MTTEEKLTALFARTSTPALVTSLRTLEATASTPEERWARAKTIEELERRHPAAEAAVTAAFDAAEETGAEVDYVAVLLANIPAGPQSGPTGVKVTCPASGCGRSVTAQRWTGYPRRHKSPVGAWCPGVAARS